MKDFTVSVRKLTDEALMREACEMTFLGKSNQSLLSIYKSEHSPVRTQLFWVKLENIPLFISTHLIRHHVGSIPFQLTCRDDRPGGNPGLPQKVSGLISRLHSISDMIKSQRPVYDITNALYQCEAELEWLADNSDRYTPVNLALCVNAQSLMDMAKLRLCSGTAHKETVKVFKAIKEEIKKVDPDLASMMVRKCVYRNGLCGEGRCCGFNSTPAFAKEMAEYRQNFSNKQLGIRQWL